MDKQLVFNIIYPLPTSFYILMECIIQQYGSSQITKQFIQSQNLTMYSYVGTFALINSNHAKRRELHNENENLVNSDISSNQFCFAVYPLCFFSSRISCHKNYCTFYTKNLPLMPTTIQSSHHKSTEQIMHNMYNLVFTLCVHF